MKPKETAKDRLIATATELFSRQGYNGTGLTQLLTESGSPKGSFYYHFPGGKEELAEITILKAGEAIRLLIDKAYHSAPSFESGSRAWASAVASWFSKSDYAEGCPITAVMLATVPASDRLLAASHKVFTSWSTTAATHAERFGHEDQANQLGDAMVLSLEGAWILSRATRTTTPFDTAADMIIALLK